MKNKLVSLRNVIMASTKNIGHVCRAPKTMLTTTMLFAKSKRPY